MFNVHTTVCFHQLHHRYDICGTFGHHRHSQDFFAVGVLSILASHPDDLFLVVSVFTICTLPRPSKQVSTQVKTCIPRPGGAPAPMATMAMVMMTE